MTRVQKERFNDLAQYNAAIGLYELNPHIMTKGSRKKVKLVLWKYCINPNGGGLIVPKLFSHSYFSMKKGVLRKSRNIFLGFSVFFGDQEGVGTINHPPKLNPEAPQY